jgi:hypothetical protein
MIFNYRLDAGIALALMAVVVIVLAAPAGMAPRVAQPRARERARRGVPIERRSRNNHQPVTEST